MRSLLKGLRRNEDGATMVEYGLIVAVIAVAAMIAMEIMGKTILAPVYELISSKVEEGAEESGGT